MANILIVDLLEESAYLLRSLLRGKGHNISIAISDGEARAKLETGLFDTLLADLCEPNATNLGIVRHCNDLTPMLPVVALAREEGQEALSGVELFGRIFRPIRGQRVNEVCGRALAHAQALSTRRKGARVSVDIPLSVEFGEERFDARMSDLSERGFAINADDGVLDEDRLSRIVAMIPKEKLKAVIVPTKGESFAAAGRIAFVDRQRRFERKVIGVIFDELEGETRAHVNSLLKITAKAA